MIQLKQVAVRNGSFSLSGLRLEIPRREYGVLMGKTGCGKSTVLEAICGLKRVSAGSISLHGEDVTQEKPANRGIGYVPQDAALFLHMTVARNIAFSLHIRNWSPARIAERVAEVATLVGIRALLARTPHGLSGGERQRVALGRALAFRPTTLCLDEPLSALDAESRLEMCDLLRKVQAETKVTTIHITHDAEEAKRLGNRLFRFVNGKIVQEK